MNIKGYTYGFDGKRGDYRSQEGIYSQEKLYDTGVNWVCLAFPVHQDRCNSTDIRFDFKYGITDKDIHSAVNRAHGRGVKVCLKPMINCKDGIWRAEINFPDGDMWGNDPYWKKWFDSYTHFLLHYAEIAEDSGCEMFCLGCEMLGTERKEKFWRELIQRVRRVYHGPLVYNTNHGKEDNVKWFDSIDYIGTSAYYPVAQEPGASKEQMETAWEKVRYSLKPLSEKLGKKVIFMEIGCRSASGCAAMPWDFTHTDLPMDEQEQADFYDSCLSVFSGEEWFEGLFWWDWSTKVYQSREAASQDRGFNIHMKKAEEVLRRWYTE